MSGSRKILLMENVSKSGARECAFETETFLRGLGVEVIKDEKNIGEADFCIVIGGDGTFIHAAKQAALHKKPILGINMGKLGFMTTLEASEIHKLDKLLAGDYKTEKRMILDVRVGGRQQLSFNDAVISRGNLSRMIDIRVSVNGRLAADYRADGLIVSTPTGSTAYALSAGGPVIDPEIDCISVTPVCPHSLFSRTIAFSPEHTITVDAAGEAVSDSNAETSEIYLTVDGENALRILPGQAVEIKRSVYEAQLINLSGQAFYEILRQKMGKK